MTRRHGEKAFYHRVSASLYLRVDLSPQDFHWIRVSVDVRILSCWPRARRTSSPRLLSTLPAPTAPPIAAPIAAPWPPPNTAPMIAPMPVLAPTFEISSLVESLPLTPPSESTLPAPSRFPIS